MAVLCTWTPEGGLLSVVAPLALAAARRTALVVDLDVDGPAYPGDGSLAALVAEGPTRRDLSPQRSGVAVLRNGGISSADAIDVLEALAGGWPSLVLRLGGGGDGPGALPVVPVRSLLPGWLAEEAEGPVVYQRCGWWVRAPGPGPVLPRPRKSTLRALLEGRRPFADRWVRSWRQVWSASWT